MFLIKIFHFLKGYVILLISGHNKEEFLNSILKIGIKPIRMDYCDDGIIAALSVSDFFRIREADIRARVHILKKRGAVFVAKRLKKRKAFVVGMLAFVMMFALGSQFIWTVSYEGVESCDIQQLEKAVELAGLHEGMLKRNLKSGLEMKNIILNHTDNICWAWVYVKGTKAVVKVREDILPPEVFDPNVPCDIVAMRSGIIKRVITTHGKCVAAENQAVAPGDTIISGTYNFENEPGYQVHSAGVVEAYTEHVKTGTYKQNYCYKKYSGRKRRLVTLKFLKWELPLYLDGDIKYESYDSLQREYDLKLGKDYYPGLGIRVVTCEEYAVEKEPISYDVAAELAIKELEKEISRELLPGSKLIDRHEDVQKLDEETISVTLTMNFIEQIGTEKRIEEVTFIEPKTDRTAAGD
ncbi:MAG: sporulation protein YqfD [Clostridia bacterium]|nr:sporulation protein YqfD [Clostridia bacterium]